MKCVKHPKYICLLCPYVDAKITWFCFFVVEAAFSVQWTNALERVRIPRTNLLVQCGVSVLRFLLENKENRLGAIERHSQGFYCFSVSHFGCRILVFLPSIAINVIFIVSRHLFGGVQTLWRCNVEDGREYSELDYLDDMPLDILRKGLILDVVYKICIKSIDATQRPAS